MRPALVAALLVACSPPVAREARPLGVIGEGPWARQTIYSGLLGADGVDVRDIDGDGLMDVTTPWEQSGRVTVSLGSGESVALGQGLSLGAVEDAAFGDIDGDGLVDVVSASEGKKIVVHYQPAAGFSDWAAWGATTIAAASGVCRWMRVVPVDMDGDGDLDILAGGKSTPAVVAWFELVGNPRLSSSWVRHDLGPVGWTMALEVADLDLDGDLDVYLSDRQYQTTTPRDYSLMGDRWLERGTAAGWISHPIGPVAGEHRMGSLVDWDGDGDLDVVSCRVVAGASALSVRLRDPGGTVEVPIPAPGGVGVCQHVVAGDLDGDGALDLVVSHSEAVGDLSGLVWLRGPTWARGEIGGAAGVKYDNVRLVDMDADGDLDVVTSEQTDQLGVVWYVNPRAPVTIPPDAAPPQLCACCELCQ